MPIQITTNFKGSNNVDLGSTLITKDFLLDVYPNILTSITTTPGLYAWGDNDFGQGGVNGGSDRPTPVTAFSSGNNNWKYISSFHFHSAAINTSNELWLWGWNAYGQIGINDTSIRYTPTKVFNSTTGWDQVSCGQFHTSAIKVDGSLWVWGRNNNGQLGTNGGGDKYTPLSQLVGWKQVDCGHSHTCAVKSNGTLWCWGNNYSGQLGLNNNTTRSTPVTVFGTAAGNYQPDHIWKQIACGGYHTVGIKMDGTLWSWGLNVSGQLGVNDTTNRITPVPTNLGGTNWKQVSCGKKHTVAIKTDGSLWSWGANASGQLGINNTSQRNSPVREINNATNWNSVACGGYTTAAVKSDGTLWMFGYNNQSQIGLNDTTARQTPVPVGGGGTNWKKVAAGYQHTVAILSSSSV